jgi:hypothetical protein
MMTARPLLAFCAALACAALLAACATLQGGAPGPPAPAPALKPGDRWVYRGREGFRLPTVWEETHEVTSVTPDITVRVTYTGGVKGDRTELLAAPGLVRVGALMDIETRRFKEPLRRFAFPLTPGESWNQWVENRNDTTHRAGRINRYGQVGGWEKVSTPAGTFDAIRVRVFMTLDDEEFWRSATRCNYLIWYAPAVGAVVREDKDAENSEKGDRFDTAPVRAQNTLIVLVSYRRAG